jgi:hypothetical protein
MGEGQGTKGRIYRWKETTKYFRGRDSPDSRCSESSLGKVEEATEDGVSGVSEHRLYSSKVRYFEIEYSTPGMALPHSKQQALSRDVINPQDGHILCDWRPATRGVTLRFRRSNTVAQSKMSRPRKILVAFTG